MTYDELFQLKGLEKAKLLAGRSILDREIVGAHVVEIAEAQDWAKRGELIFVSGVAFRNVEEDLTEAINELAKKQVAGVVLEVGPYIKEVTDDIIDLANELNLPLLSLPYEVHVSEIISQIYFDKYSKEEANKSVEKFMTQLLYDDEESALKRIELFRYDTGKRHVAIYVSADEDLSVTDNISSNKENIHCNMDESDEKNMIVKRIDESDKTDVSEDILKAVRMSFTRQPQLLYLKEEDGVAAVIELESNDKLRNMMYRKRDTIEENLSYRRKNITISMGVGTVFSGEKKKKNSVEEAKKASKVIRTGNEKSSLRFYDEIGIYRVFFELQDNEVLYNLLEENLGNLIRYDSENDSEMVHTLEVYLEQNCNIAAATDALYVHRNTVKYRIKRIGEILGRDLKDVTVQFNLRMAFKIRSYLGK